MTHTIVGREDADRPGEDRYERRESVFAPDFIQQATASIDAVHQNRMTDSWEMIRP